MSNSVGIFGKIITSPDESYNENKRFWQGCPTIARTHGGILFAGWYTGGTGEPSPLNCNVLVKSTDNGETWSDVQLVIASNPELHVRAIDIQLWISPDKRMWAFWTIRDDNYLQNDINHLKLWAMICENPDADELTWSEPKLLTHGFLRCQPTVLSDGRILLFSYDWSNDRYSYSESSDGGKTWCRKIGGKKVNTPFDEAMAVEKLDGSIWMMARCEEKALAQSFSYDGGKSWTDGEVTNLVSPSSRFYLKRLPSGKLLLIRNAKIERRREWMTASLSDDDGATWKWSLLLDPDTNVSYPDAVFDDNGTIYIVHDHGRNDYKEILFSRITESDIIAGKLATPDSCLKHIISKAPTIPVDKEEFLRLKAADELWKEQYKARNSGKF